MQFMICQRNLVIEKNLISFLTSYECLEKYSWILKVLVDEVKPKKHTNQLFFKTNLHSLLYSELFIVYSGLKFHYIYVFT